MAVVSASVRSSASRAPPCPMTLRRAPVLPKLRMGTSPGLGRGGRAYAPVRPRPAKSDPEKVLRRIAAIYHSGRVDRSTVVNSNLILFNRWRDRYEAKKLRHGRRGGPVSFLRIVGAD